MTLSVTHSFTSAIADDPTAAAAGEVLPSHWNAAHTISGGAANAIPFFDGSGNLTIGSGLAWDNSAQVLGVTSTSVDLLVLASSSTDHTGFVLSNSSTGGHTFHIYTTGSANGLGPGHLGFYDVSGAVGLDIAYTQVSAAANGNFSWSSLNNIAGYSPDTFLWRDAAGIIAQQNGTNAQTFRVYNTWSSSGANYERGVFDWQTTANVLRIGTENAGTGVLRDLALVNGSTTIFRVWLGLGSSVGIGSLALHSITTGTKNFALGGNTLSSLQDGQSNVAIGTNCLQSTVSDHNNIAIGEGALALLNGNWANVAVGVGAGNVVSTGGGNLFLGSLSGSSVTTGSNNSVVGSWAGAAAMANVIALSDGQANLKLDYNYTTSSVWTAAAPFNVAANGASGTPAVKVAGNIYVGTTPFFEIITNGGSTTGFSSSGTIFGINNAAGFSGNVFDFWVGGVQVFTVDYQGLLTANNITSFHDFNVARYISWGNFTVLDGRTDGDLILSNGAISHAVTLSVDGASNVLALRNSTNAQTFRVYNTWSSAGANYERGVFDWGTTSNVLTIGTQAGGTGVARNIAFVSPATSGNPFTFVANGSTAVTFRYDGYVTIANAIANVNEISAITSAGVDIGSGGIIRFQSGSQWYAGADTGVSRSAAGVLAFGNGTAADASACIKAKTKAGAPTTSDVPNGTWVLIRDTTNNTTKMYYNNAGTLMTVALI